MIIWADFEKNFIEPTSAQSPLKHSEIHFFLFIILVYTLQRVKFD